MQTPYRGQPKIVVALTQNAILHAGVAKPVRLHGGIGKISGLPSLSLQDVAISRSDDKSRSNPLILRLAYSLFLPFWELAAQFLRANYAFLIQTNDSARVTSECYHSFDGMI
ncbi:hypothetical protein [Rhizobium mayense]|uniref:Uncharacterized protein n=1 Tax=Rhizobium mayense TaxID=1312184 RepID=A0ABT7JQK8_9HYPH|nr:hypothetical protein [Rhizobium mayense]MDL2398634.1 hypothetical protein [Rhizobium mayense]